MDRNAGDRGNRLHQPRGLTHSQIHDAKCVRGKGCVVLKELAALVKLSEIDAAAVQVDQELEKIPAELDDLRADVGRLEGLLGAERAQLKEAEGLYSQQESEIQEQNQALSRSKAKGAKVRNTREADAVERELEAVRRTLKERETERDRLRDAIEHRRGAIAKHDKDFEELRTYASEQEEKSRIRLAELQAERRSIVAGREATAVDVTGEVLRRYDMIRKKRAGIGVAKVEGGNCGACHVALPPQQMIKVRRGDSMEQCPRCLRILYSPTTVASSD